MNCRRYQYSLVQFAQQVQVPDPTQADKRSGVGNDDPRHKATAISSSRSSAG